MYFIWNILINLLVIFLNLTNNTKISFRYGDAYGLADAICSGYCPAGFYCPMGTSKPIQCPPYAYSLGGSWVCNSCPNAAETALPCQDSMTCCFRGN